MMNREIMESIWAERLRMEKHYHKILLIASRLSGDRKSATVKINRPLEYQKRAV